MVDALDVMGGIGLLVLACVIFQGVSILCDEHLCPCLDRLCDRFKLPTALAAATFVSFGSSAPELIISTLGAVDNKTEMSIPAVLCSALIAFAAIPPMVVRATGPIELLMKGVARDALFYMGSLLLFLHFNSAKEIGWMAAATLVVYYFVYLVVVYFTSSHDSPPDDDGKDMITAISEAEVLSPKSLPMEGEHHRDRMYDRFCLRKAPSFNERNANYRKMSSFNGSQCSSNAGSLARQLLGTGNEDEDAEERHGVVWFVNKAFEAMFDWTICEGAISGFVGSLIWLGILSYGAMTLAERVVKLWGISSATAGITLLAWGGQLPDTLAAVALAKAGKPDEAISQAIASQVINVSIGLGLPLLTYTIATGRPTITSKRETISSIAVCVLLSILAYGVAMTPRPTTLRDWINNPDRISATISINRAKFLGVSFLVLYGSTIALSEYGTSWTTHLMEVAKFGL